jgi:hypothetical protein
MHAGFTGAWDPEMPHAVRQHEVDHIAWEISFRSDLDGVPAVVQDFLFGPWCKVLAHVRHRPALEASGESLRFERAVDDLLWSVKPELTLRAPQRLFEVVPRMLETLREGLRHIGYSPQLQQEFLRELMELHRPVLKLRAAKQQRDFGPRPRQ